MYVSMLLASGFKRSKKWAWRVEVDCSAGRDKWEKEEKKPQSNFITRFKWKDSTTNMTLEFLIAEGKGRKEASK